MLKTSPAYQASNQFKTIDARWFDFNAEWFVRHLIPALEDLQL